MTSLIGWLLDSEMVPHGTLVWASGGMGLALALGALLLITTVAIAALRERRHEEPRSATDEKDAGHASMPADSRLPSAA